MLKYNMKHASHDLLNNKMNYNHYLCGSTYRGRLITLIRIDCTYITPYSRNNYLHNNKKLNNYYVIIPEQTFLEIIQDLSKYEV